ncbi:MULTISPECIES: three component ABC system middle component [unclassified Streptomyces]|uniref:three component ABC system middle component n=1 Tax=unclassified Streptomyces TaxID=2593676 RepID=UPI002E28E929|nr:three component ABC system middle component [Streptomyces sp. NBC_00343]
MSTPLTRQLPEAAALFNPAFGAFVLAHCVAAHMAAGPSLPLPFPSTFLVLPLVLPPDTRSALPRDVRTPLSGWLADNPVLRASFPRRAVSLTEYTRIAERFGIRHGAFVVRSGGLIVESQPRRPNASAHGAELVECTRKAALVGRWLASMNPATAFTLLGVRP